MDWLSHKHFFRIKVYFIWVFLTGKPFTERAAKRIRPHLLAVVFGSSSLSIGDDRYAPSLSID